MKKQITFLTGLSLLLGLTFTACEEEGNDTPEERVLYPKTITEYENGVLNDTQTFEYNSNKQLIKRDYGYGYYETYEYDEEGKLIFITYNEANEVYNSDSLIYNNNDQLIKIQAISANDNIMVGLVIFEYNSAGFVSKRSEYLSDGTHYSNWIYTYDSEGNIVYQKNFYRDQETEVIPTDVYDEVNYEYDNKNNIFKSIGLPFRYKTHINNVTKKTFTEIPEHDDDFTTTYTYTYNSDNYPVEYVDNYGCKYEIEYIEL